MAPNKKPGRWRPPSVRANERLKGINGALLRRAGLGPQLAGMSGRQRGRWLRALREMALLYARSPRERAERIAWLSRELPGRFRQLGLDPADLGAGSLDQLMRVFIRMMRRVELRKTYASVAELKRKAGGFRSTPLGELFELLGDNLRDLRLLRRGLESDALDELNHLLKAAAHLLRSAGGAAVKARGKFTTVVEVRDLKIKLKGVDDPKKYVDRASLSPLEPQPGKTLDQPYHGLLVGVELKLRGAAKRGLAKQTAKMEPRLEASNVEWLECVDMKTGRKLKIYPQQLIYSPLVRRVGVTHPREGRAPMVQWKPTRGPEGDLYLRYEADIKVSKLRFLVDMLFPVGSKKR